MNPALRSLEAADPLRGGEISQGFAATDAAAVLLWPDAGHGRRCGGGVQRRRAGMAVRAALWPSAPACRAGGALFGRDRSEEHTSELQSLMRISYAVFCLKKRKSRGNKHT